MKAVLEMAPSSVAEGVNAGRIARRRDVENEEIQMYLSKLKDLVPFMPKNRKLSKLEVIRHVIEYICELQYALESHPAVSVDPAELTARLGGDSSSNSSSGSSAGPRQPLGTLAPSPNTPCSSPPSLIESSSRSMSPSDLDKTQQTDIRPVSC